MSATAAAIGGVALERVLPALQRMDASARACWVYDLDALESRARRMRAAFAPSVHVAYALKANALPVVLAAVRDAGLAAEAGSLGELELATRAGFAPSRIGLNGNGRTPEEALWVATRGVHSVNADAIEELDLLERHAAPAGRSLRVALRVNPDIDAPVHRYIATGHADAKFGVAPAQALEAWAARARWPHLRVDGVHLHVGSQLQDAAPLEAAARFAVELAAESARRGAPLGLVNTGGGLGIDYTGTGVEFPLETYAATLSALARETALEWAVEPGRWLVAPVGVLVAEVLAVKRRGARRFVTLAAGLNDLLRPALYGARHRMVAVGRDGAPTPAVVVGPVCESSDQFDTDARLPEVVPGDAVAILDAGAYGSAMSSNYNGRGRLAEVVARGGTLACVRAAEPPAALAARDLETHVTLE